MNAPQSTIRRILAGLGLAAGIAIGLIKPFGIEDLEYVRFLFCGGALFLIFGVLVLPRVLRNPGGQKGPLAFMGKLPAPVLNAAVMLGIFAGAVLLGAGVGNVLTTYFGGGA